MWKDVKERGENVEEIVAVDRNSYGDIISFRTSSGRVISYRKALEEIEAGNLTGVQIQHPEQPDHLPIIQNLQGDLFFENYPPIY